MVGGNHYYKQVLQEGPGNIIDLIAVDDSPNAIQINIADDCFNTTSAVVLTEQEQNDLIYGILERRGMTIISNGEMDNGQKLLTAKSGCVPAISATGNEQSVIHPVETPSNILANYWEENITKEAKDKLVKAINNQTKNKNS